MFGIKDNEEFIQQLGIANLPEEQRNVIVQGLENIAQKKLVTRLSERLSDEQTKQFATLDSDEAVSNWLQQNVPDFLTIVSEILAEMKTDILSKKAQVVG